MFFYKEPQQKHKKLQKLDKLFFFLSFAAAVVVAVIGVRFGAAVPQSQLSSPVVVR